MDILTRIDRALGSAGPHFPVLAALLSEAAEEIKLLREVAGLARPSGGNFDTIKGKISDAKNKANSADAEPKQGNIAPTADLSQV